MVRKRPVWILPDNDIAAYPFDGVTASGTRGYLYKAMANIQPLPITYSDPYWQGIAGTQKKAAIYRTDIYPRPAVVTHTYTVEGGNVYAYAYKSFLYIKEPQLTLIGPASSEIDSCSANWSTAGNTAGGLFTSYYVSVSLDSNPAAVVYLVNGSDTGTNESGTSNLLTGMGVTELAEGETYSVHAWVQGGTVYTISSGNYFYENTTIDVVGTGNDPSAWTVTCSGTGNSTAPGGSGGSYTAKYTTTDVPQWVIMGDAAATEEGTQCYIAWNTTYASLSTVYADYKPWELR